MIATYMGIDKIVAGSILAKSRNLISVTKRVDTLVWSPTIGESSQMYPGIIFLDYLATVSYQTPLGEGKNIPWYMKSGQYGCHPSCHDYHREVDDIGICQLVKQHEEEECTEDMCVKFCRIILVSGCE